MEKINEKALMFAIELAPIIIALILSIYWCIFPVEIKSDPYLLGFFRGVIWPTFIYAQFKFWFKIALLFKNN